MLAPALFADPRLGHGSPLDHALGWRGIREGVRGRLLLISKVTIHKLVARAYRGL